MPLKPFFVLQAATPFLLKICTLASFVFVTYAWLDEIYAGLCLYFFPSSPLGNPRDRNVACTLCDDWFGIHWFLAKYLREL